MGNKVSKAQQDVKPTYDPQKNYKWEADDIFELSGVDFSTVYNTLKEAALARGGTTALNLVASYNLLQALLVRGIEAGVVKEVVPETAPSPVENGEVKKPSVRKKTANP